MSTPNSEKVNTSMTGDGTDSLDSHEVDYVGNAAASSNVTITLEEVARHILAASDHVTKQLEKICELVKVL